MSARDQLKAEKTPKEGDLNMLEYTRDPEIERRGHLVAPTKRWVWYTWVTV